MVPALFARCSFRAIPVVGDEKHLCNFNRGQQTIMVGLK
jgi:hypothetical protein